MGGLFGSPPSANVVTRYTQLQVQTAVLGQVVPVGWGKSRWAPNIIWYGDFRSYVVSKGGKGGGGKGSNQYTYTTAVELALGEAPPSSTNTLSIDRVWVDQGTSTLGSLNLQLFNGTQTSPPAWMATNFPDAAEPYHGIAFLFSSLYQLQGSPSIPQHNFEVTSGFSGAISGFPDANFADCIKDMCQNELYGVDPGSDWIDEVSRIFFKAYTQAQKIIGSPYCYQAETGTSILSRWAQLCNSFISWDGVALKFIPLGTETLNANGAVYTPNLSPIFDFGMDDYIVKPGDAPVQVTIADPRDCYNRIEVDTLDRSANYKTNPILSEDLASVDQFGPLKSQIINAPEICEASVGAIVANLILQRAVNVRRTYKFKVSADSFGIVLSCGDPITITDPFIGLSRWPVRVIDAKGNKDGEIDVTCEEMPAGLGQNTVFPPQSNDNTSTVNVYVAPGPVNPPMVLEAPLTDTGGVPSLLIGASGGSSNWGGAQVYISTDGDNFLHAGTINGPTQQGTLTASLPASADPDLTHTLSLDTTESLAILDTGTTQENANLFQTASLIDEEILSYGTVSLTGTNTYALTYLRRGYESSAGSHASGAQWWRINPAVSLKYTIPSYYVGETLTLKLCSFNVFGNETEALADVTPYTYVVRGTAFQIAPPTGVMLAAALVGSQIIMRANWTASVGPSLGSYEAQFSPDSGANWTYDAPVGGGSTFTQFGPVASGLLIQCRVRAISINGQAISTWAYSAVVNSNTAIAVPTAPTSLTATALTGTSVELDIGAATGATFYEIYRAPGTSTPIGSCTLIGTTTSLSYTDTVSSGSTLTYYVEGGNTAGLGPPAGPANVTTTGAVTLTSGGTFLLSSGSTLVTG